MRQCPTLEGDDRPLIAHTIGPGLCLSRQRTYYHKCHRCIYRGKPASYVLDAVRPPSQPSANGTYVQRRESPGRLDLPKNRREPQP